MMRRRDVIGGLISVPAASTAAMSKPAVTGFGGGLLPVNGTRLWVTDTGPRHAPAILYVHGGPGVGALDFEHYMIGPLAGRVRLISVDQRGVLRSDPLPSGAAVTIGTLIDDFEAIRKALGIPRWSVLGHSFGGTVALRYALAHPHETERLIFECPSIDLASSFRWLSAAAAQALNGQDIDAAVRAARLADPSTPFDDRFISGMDEVLSALGSHRQDLYIANVRNRDIFSRLAATTGLAEARWSQGATPGRLLLANPSTRRSMLASIAAWKGPMLLLRGEGDHVTSPQELAAVRAAGGTIITVPDAGHFVHVEQPMALTKLIAS